MDISRYLVLFSVFLPTLGFSEGVLSVSPTHDFRQGNGSVFSLDIDEHIVERLYWVPEFSLSTLQGYRDASGKIDTEYRWTERFSTGVGIGYDSYHHFGDSRVESEETHVKFKLKLW